MSYTLKNITTIGLKVAVLLTVWTIGSTVASAASLYLSPATGVYSSGQTFTARVVVNTSGSPINAADGTISFNANELSVVGISKGSIFNLWTAEPSFSNTAGTISFSGGSPSGYTGSAGTVLNVTFRAKGSGATKVNFANGSVLAADGRGTNVLTSMSGGSYTISAATAVPDPEVIVEYVPPANTPAAPKVTSDTHPDPAGWYTEKNARLTWDVPAGVTAVRTLLDSNASSIPSKVYSNPISSITLDDLDEGVQYFHIQFQNADGWGRVAHYRLAVDTIPPSDLQLELSEAADLSSPTQIINVTVTEDTSEITSYDVRLDNTEPVRYEETGSSTIILENLEPGYHTAVVEVFDAANNKVIGNISFTIDAFAKPVFTDYPSEINEDVIPVIKGETRPNSAVAVTIAQIGGSGTYYKQVYQVQSNEEGVFTVIPDGTFPLGVYELTAVATDQFGAKSAASDSVRMAVQQPGYVQIGSLAISILSVVIPVIALCALLILGLLYFATVFRRLRKSVEKEAREATAILKKEFAALQTELNEHGKTLAASRRTKKLTKAEAAVIDSIRTSLTESEKRVEKELVDVEDIVD